MNKFYINSSRIIAKIKTITKIIANILIENEVNFISVLNF